MRFIIPVIVVTCAIEAAYPGDSAQNGEEENHGDQITSGTIVYPNGDVYTGQIINGAPHGTGKVIFNDGGSYEGGFDLGHATGYATIHYPTGNVYTGHVVDIIPHGEGNMDYATRRVDPPSPDPTDPETRRILDLMFPDDDEEVEQVLHQDRYEGEWLNGEWHGNGDRYFPNGDVYRGQFHNGLIHGIGTMQYASPPYLEYTRFTGTWVEGQRHGHG